MKKSKKEDYYEDRFIHRMYFNSVFGLISLSIILILMGIVLRDLHHTFLSFTNFSLGTIFLMISYILLLENKKIIKRIKDIK